jgi:hypothetical protein
MIMNIANWVFGENWDGPSWHIAVPLTAFPLLAAVITALLFWT